MKRRRTLLVSVLLGMFFLIGCAAEKEHHSFSLEEMGSVSLEDTETPVRYSVNPSHAKDEVLILKNEITYDGHFSLKEEIYDLEKVTVTDDEIVIEYEGQVEIFQRLSSSVVENEDKVQYQSTDTSGK